MKLSIKVSLSKAWGRFDLGCVGDSASLVENISQPESIRKLNNIILTAFIFRQ